MNANKTLWLLDLDRTLLQTEKLNELTIQAAGKITGDENLVAAMRERWKAVEAAGQPYGAIGQLRETLDEETIALIDQHILEIAVIQDLLEPGAPELLRALRAQQLAHGIMTYGPDDRQLFKLKLLGFDRLPFIITSTPDKASIIREWHNGDYFLPPIELATGTFDRVALLDDKAIAFAHLPAGMEGFLYRSPHTPLLKAQEGSVPVTVQEINHLLDLIPFFES